MKLFFTSLFLLTVSICFAQRQNVYFLKNNGKYVNIRDSADYIRIVREPDSASTLYNVIEFYLNGAQKLVGKSRSIDPPKYEGPCITYYANGLKQRLSNYKNNSKTGNEVLYYPNGKRYLLLNYPEKETRESEYRNDALIESCNDSLGNVLVKDGNGYMKSYDDKFNYVEEEGNIKNGRRDGNWKGEYRDNHITFTESYDNGKLLIGNASNRYGKTSTYSGTRGVPPEFKGGIEGFGRYLSRNIRYPDLARQKGIQGQVILSFVVEKNGELSDIKVSKSVMPLFDDEAIRVLKESPKWIPGTQFGMPVRVQYSVPITFTLGN
ncbi:TonB family protein [Mucilaginibacter sp. 22184]|uniref:TonB family protein n=1 Tax=Mucilaginibacter sp. 22184 TaxID=3453887 RepID=UPI003F831529